MNKIEQNVKQLIHKYGCADPFLISEKMGIITVDRDLPEHINGFTVTMEEIPFIVLNTSLNYHNRKITAAHELGHIVLHGTTNTIKLSLNTSFCVSKFEKEADCFAAYLLLASEKDETVGMDSVTAEDISKLTHLPKSMIEDAFFG